MLPEDSSFSFSRECAAEGVLWPAEQGSVTTDPHRRSAGIDADDVNGCCCITGTLLVLISTRSIRISEWFVQLVPVRWKYHTSSKKKKKGFIFKKVHFLYEVHTLSPQNVIKGLNIGSMDFFLRQRMLVWCLVAPCAEKH